MDQNKQTCWLQALRAQEDARELRDGAAWFLQRPSLRLAKERNYNMEVRT